MRRATGILMAGLLVACGGVEPRGATADAGLGAGCGVDADCPAGMVCEGCADGSDRQCVPGCRERSQCGANQLCSLSVACFTCPCAPGWCVVDPCHDFDGDGYVPTRSATLVCPGKQKGDCDDADPRVNPAAVERCADGVDDDCDGKIDQADPQCRACLPTERRCNLATDCGPSRTCDRGCCVACPAVARPGCEPGECLLPGGVDPKSGCFLDSVCGPCASCPPLSQPLCGATFATYGNECYLRAAGVALLHPGACAAGEGLDCTGAQPNTQGPCPWGTWCRAVGPAKAQLTCLKAGTCDADADCPAGLQGTAFCSDGTVAPLVCEGHRCRARCP